MPVMLAFVVVVLIWGTTPLAIRWSAEDVNLWFALGARMLIGFVLSYIWMRARGERLQLEPAALKLYAASLLGTVLAMGTVYWSTRYIASGLISVLFGLAPILGGIYAGLLHDEAFLDMRRLLGVAGSLVGLAVIFAREVSLGSDGWKGVAGVLLAVNLYALSTVLIKRLSSGYSSLTVNTGSLGASLLLLIPAWLFSDGHWPQHIAPRATAAIVYLGVFGSFVGFVSYYYLVKRVPAATAMCVTLVTPLLALYLGTALNGESIDSRAVAGSLLVLSGLAIYLWSALVALMQTTRVRFTRR